MKKKFEISRKIVWGLFVFSLILFVPVCTKAAAYGTIGNGRVMYAWPLSKSRLTVYHDPEMTEKAAKNTWREYIITEISGNTAYVTYETKDGEKAFGYVPLDKFIYDVSYKRTGAYVARSTGVYLYKTPAVASKKKSLFIPFRSGGITLGVKDHYVQMMFRKGKNFYLGWIALPTFQQIIYHSALHTDQILADGTYTLTPYRQNRKSAEAERFKVRYQGGGLYTLKSIENKDYLEIREQRAIKIVRCGSMFFLRSADEKYGLNYAGCTRKASPADGQKWKLKKKYVVPKQEKSTVFSQYDPEIGSSVYQDGYEGPRTISSSGCGLISLVNAIYALNGEYIPPKKLAKFSVSRGHYFYNSGTADTLYPDVAGQWGKTYHFRYAGCVTSFHTLRNHLQKKGTAVALVPGHYIAIVAYRKQDGRYLVLDSAVSGSRPTSIYGDWMTEAQLRSGRMYCQHMHLFFAR